MIVLDASVVIAWLNPSDALHEKAGSMLESNIAHPFALHAMTRAEALVAPTRAGKVSTAERQIDDLIAVTVPLGADDAIALARIRAESGLRLPDCCALLAAQGLDAAVVSFDDRLRRAAERLGLAVV